MEKLIAGKFPDDKNDIYHRSFVLKVPFCLQIIKGKIGVVTHTTIISAMTTRDYNFQWHKFTYATHASIVR